MVENKKYSEQVYAYPIYKYNSKSYKAFVRLMVKIKANRLLKNILGKWAKELKDYDIIICEGLKGRTWVFEFLLKNKSLDSKIIMWHWNKIYVDEISPNDKIAKMCEQWSFDPDDCENYNLKFNTQYFSKININEQSEKKWDAYFLGTDKNRVFILLKLENILKELHLNTNFHIVKSPLQEANKEIVYKDSISYVQNIENVIKSNILIDVPIINQRGFTLRVLEALFYKRKLISFNPDLKKEKFYNENNILIIGINELDSSEIKEKIKEFFNKPYEETEENEIARKYYSFEEWMLRFLNK